MDSKNSYDVIIVGGGIMGSTTAYYLTRKDPGLKVAVIERDLAYTRASTTLSMVNARIQFSLRQNVEISQYAFNVLERFEDDMTVAGQRCQLQRGHRHAFRQRCQKLLAGEHPQACGRHLELTAEHILQALCKLFSLPLLHNSLSSLLSPDW